MMFNFGLGELLIIIILFILLIKPEDIPFIMQDLNKFTKQIINIYNKFKMTYKIPFNKK